MLENITTCFFFFLVVNIPNITSINRLALKPNEKSYTLPFNSFFFMLLAAKSVDAFPKNNEYVFILKFFCLKRI